MTTTITRPAAKRKYLLRACPRCHGDLFRDAFEEAFTCLQCGRGAGLEAVEARLRELALAA